MSTPLLAVGLVMLLVGLVAVYSGVRIVDEGEVHAVLLFGAVIGVLGPGFNFVPPFVARTRPIDPSTMTVERDGESVPVPGTYEDRVRDALEISDDNSTSHASGPMSYREQIATVVGLGLFGTGALGLLFPVALLFELVRPRSEPFTVLVGEVTPRAVALALVAPFAVMFVGEYVGKTFGRWPGYRAE